MNFEYSLASYFEHSIEPSGSKGREFLDQLVTEWNNLYPKFLYWLCFYENTVCRACHYTDLTITVYSCFSVHFHIVKQ